VWEQNPLFPWKNGIFLLTAPVCFCGRKFLLFFLGKGPFFLYRVPRTLFASGSGTFLFSLSSLQKISFFSSPKLPNLFFRHQKSYLLPPLAHLCWRPTSSFPGSLLGRFGDGSSFLRIKKGLSFFPPPLKFSFSSALFLKSSRALTALSPEKDPFPLISCSRSKTRCTAPPGLLLFFSYLL